MDPDTDMHPEESAGAGTTFDADAFEDAPGGGFVVDLEGFEGPLDLLLALARSHKLDLTRISMLALSQQYLDYVGEARRLRLEVAADYLVMAAWLAYLKSRLLLPADESQDGEPTGEDLAAALALRLKRLMAMREAAARLMTRKRLGRDIFARGQPEGIRMRRTSKYDANVFDLLKAYAQQRQRTAIRALRFARRPVWSIKDARARLERLLGTTLDWAPVDRLVAQYLGEAEEARTAIASTFGATLEMTREGMLELRQAHAFAPLYVRARAGAKGQ